MRLSLMWRGKPLLAVDLTDQPPDDATYQGPSLQSSGNLQDSTRAEPMQPDTQVFGIGRRPESHSAN